MRVDPSLPVEEQMGNLPDIGRGGWFTVSPYNDLAHLLTVRKMLSRFPKVLHYMDAEHVQSAAALTAFADDIRTGRWEIALYQKVRTDKKGKGADPKVIIRQRWPKRKDGKREAFLKNSADAQWKEREARWKKRVEEDDLFAAAGEADPQIIAKHFAEAREGARSPGGWAWLNHPPAALRYDGGYSLWLTQRPGVSYEAVGRELLWRAAVLPVDRAHSHLRDDIRSFERARTRAKPGRSYRNSNLDPFVLFAELAIAMFWRNFGPRHHAEFRDKELQEKEKKEREQKAAGGPDSGKGKKKGKKKREKSKPRPPPARSMGLAGPNEGRKPDLAGLAWGFRLSIPHLREMNEWLQK